MSIDAIRVIASFFYINRQAKPRYNLFTMQVVVEYALVENFCMDFTLLAAAKAAAKNPAKYVKIVFASVLGACFAVVYPLFGVGGVWGIVIKLVSGAAMCAVAGKYQSVKGYIKFTALFTAATFLCGGLLIAVFSLAGLEYRSGGGYILSSVPVGIPLFCAAVLALIIKKIKSKYVSGSTVTATCKVYLGDKCASCAGFYDSGNRVYSGGVPVSIIPSAVAEKLLDISGIKTFVDIHTVAGKSKIAVFTAEKMVIDDGKNKYERRQVMLGVSPQRINKIVLHPDLSEVN